LKLARDCKSRRSISFSGLFNKLTPSLYPMAYPPPLSQAWERGKGGFIAGGEEVRTQYDNWWSIPEKLVERPESVVRASALLKLVVTPPALSMDEGPKGQPFLYAAPSLSVAKEARTTNQREKGPQRPRNVDRR